MKPDQHKKKRSAQYKKKHGISKDKVDSSSKHGKEKKPAKAHQLQANSTRDQTQSQSQIQSHSTIGDAALTQNSNVIVNRDEKEFIPSFSRRKLESNWDRYEGLPDEEDNDSVTSRGAEFNRLLCETGHAEAQFRFKDEQSWEGDDEHVSEAGTKLLCIDVNALARHIKAIPIPERLGIPRSLFERNVLEKFDREASGQSSSVTGTPSIQRSSHSHLPTPPSNDDNNLSRTQVPNGAHIEMSSKEGARSHDQTTEILKESIKTSLRRTPVQNDSSDKVDVLKTNRQNESGLGGKVNADINGDDDLDLLLSLENPVEVKGQSAAACDDEDVEVQSKEDPEKEVDNHPTPSTKTVVVETAHDPDATDELEDWLDDMLDD